MIFRSFVFTALIFSGLFFGGCGSSKKIIRPHELKNLSANALYDSIISNYGTANPVAIKFNATFTVPNKSIPSVSGLIKIRRDSVIWISISALLGIEVARLKMTPDSLFVINRMQTTYYAGNYNYARQLLHFDFDFRTAQAIFLDEMFFYPPLKGDTVAAIDSMHVKSDGGNIQLKSVKRRTLRRTQRANPQAEMIQQILEINNYNLRLESVRLKDLKNDRKIEVLYSDFDAAETVLPYFPKKMDITVMEALGVYAAKLEYTRLSSDSTMTFPFEISSKYKPMAK